ncbi:MBL fold metallo-hydrolase [Maritimibacter sp. 55A14]|uniref:MBL fold metallo-hydrolase n=1 Tax=Maritimibacter sp. 55A14 TaxID=2174844 RepID=UPI000D617FC2|nr:MBL fold metallo-hydrolase [Maritimibacter sp. 55A14]PWE34202.1 MBL fold metallo-hydrolase [Maritimibacter sp. 55A14]
MARTLTHEFGDIRLTVLTDGALEFDNGVFPATDPGHIAELLEAAGQAAIRTNFNAFLIRRPGSTILVDSGPRDLFGPTAGNLPDALDETGVAPGDVDLIFFTHLHPDHIAGALTAEGAAVFPNAEVVIPEAEIAFWSDAARFQGDETMAGWQQLAAALLAAYDGRIRSLEGEAEIAPDLTAIPMPGHTPGHSGFRLDAGGQAFIHAGDVVHAQDLQLADPDVGVSFDVDAEAARAARKRCLDMIATDGLLFSGGHILRPALGRLERAGGGYRFIEDK